MTPEDHAQAAADLLAAEKTGQQIGLLSLPISDGVALYRRYERRRLAERRAKLLGFLFLRVPLIQPDRFLSQTIRWVSPLFTRAGFATWLLLPTPLGGIN